MDAVPITIEGLLINAPVGRVRMLVEPYCLDFDLGDVLDIEELPSPPGLVDGEAICVRVRLAHGARLLGMASAAAHSERVWQHQLPFALATRTRASIATSSGMKEREQEFFRARGLIGRLS